MSKHNPLKQIVAKQKKGEPVGIYSACSANEYVIEAALECAKRDNACVLIEATANQVDQNGGYTGTVSYTHLDVYKRQLLPTSMPPVISIQMLISFWILADRI